MGIFMDDRSHDRADFWLGADGLVQPLTVPKARLAAEAILLVTSEPRSLAAMSSDGVDVGRAETDATRTSMAARRQARVEGILFRVVR